MTIRYFSRSEGVVFSAIFFAACGGAGEKREPNPAGSAGSGANTVAAGGSSTGGSPASTGGATASGGSASAGTANGGTGGNATSNGGSAGTDPGGSGGEFTWGPGCATESGGAPPDAWPETAPELEPGVWKDITPAELVPQQGSNETFMAINIAFDPCHPHILYWGYGAFDGDKGGNYKSTDAGTTWTKQGNFQSVSSIRVEPGNPDHVYVGDGVRGADQGFWVSTDGGDTWTKPQGFTDVGETYGIYVHDVYYVEADPSDFNHVLVSSHSPWDWDSEEYGQDAGILESTDGGDTWIKHNPMPGWGTGTNVWFLNNSSTWLVGSQSNGYWRTTNAGGDWAQVSSIAMTHGGGQVYRTEEGVWYVSSSNQILRSTDDGGSWSQTGGPMVTTSVTGDGNYLYTHTAWDANGPFVVSPESDGATWTPYNGGAQSFNDGPSEMRVDHANGILYASNWTDGLFALKLLE